MSVGERRLLKPGELWRQEQVLCATAAEGGLLDLRSRCPGEDDPARGRESGPQRVRAQVLFQLLTGQDRTGGPHIPGVCLRGCSRRGWPRRPDYAVLVAERSLPMVNAGEEVPEGACPGCVKAPRPGKVGAAQRGFCGLPDPVTEQPYRALTGLRWR